MTLKYKFIELVKFDKREDELVTGLDKWLYLLRNLRRMNRIPACMNKRVFQKVFNIAELSKLRKEEQMMYQSSLQDQHDYENVVAFEAQKAAKELAKGIAEDMAKGIAEDMAKGIAEDMAKEMAKGMAEEQAGELTKKAAKEAAVAMKKDGFSASMISKYTKLPEEEVEKL